jgi:hypothetical protein
MRRFLPILCLLAATPASAEMPSFHPVARPLVAQGGLYGARPSGPQPIRVQVQFQLVDPVKAEEGIDAQAKAQEEMRKRFYDMAAHECAVITQALPGDCRLVSVNVNSNAMPRYNGAGGVTGHANASFEIAPKPAP